MAQIESSGITVAIRQLEQADLFDDATTKEMLTAGAETMLDAVKSAFVQAGHNNLARPRRTGETLQHFSRSRTVKKDKKGVPYMLVTISGADKRGQRYGTKGFVLNYGRRKGGKITADYYWSTAVQNTRQAVNDIMAATADKKLKGE